MKKFALTAVLFFLVMGALNAQNCNRYVDGDSTKTTAPYSIYREFFKKNLFAEALPHWRIIFEKAPGFRSQTFIDGEAMYTNLIQNTSDKALKDKYVDTLLLIYDKRMECHGFADYVLGKKAIDLIKYRNDVKGARPLFEKSLSLGGNNAYPWVIQTYYKLLITQLGTDGITPELAMQKYDELSKVLDYNIAKPDNKQLQAYKDVKTALDNLFTDNFADKNDPADCALLLDMYKKKYAENPNDLETIKTVYNKTRGCADSLLNVELLEKLNRLSPSYSYAVRLGNIYLKQNKMDTAFTLYQNAVVVETDSVKKADLYFIMATIKYEKVDYEASREFARQALQYNPNMGRAYLLIGVLYVSSGPLCGPGTGFQSQIVVWPAIDYFNKAIEVGQEDVVADAKKYISDYNKFLPTREELQKKKLNVGDAYTVECWINEATTVKAR